MKIRHGFVSNSSSSSFICDITGDTIEDGDCDLSDLGYVECENDHRMPENYVICSSIFSKQLFNPGESVEFYRELLKNEYPSANDKYLDKHAKLLFETKEDEIPFKQTIIDYYSSEDKQIKTKFCPVCNLHNISDYFLFEYVINKFKLSRLELTDEMRQKYKTYVNMYKDLL